MIEPVVIGLGGNVGTEAAIVGRFDRARAALAELAGAAGGLRSARLYRSAPIGPDQPAFLNTAVQVALDGVQPGELIAALLEHLHGIERLLGRRRAGEARWGPRPIDLDVLVWGARVVRTPDLEVPHPRLAERRFALLPLIDLAGEDFVVPGHGPAGALARRVADQPCDELAAGW
ncbi:MAG TPA: 2-amino-4-hydroxy-6-hydroxymethyldihydropteridine diphosphokinase [Kofleriaceae bacterium]|nr:2-amino-4-hydroxy-6-hydroxymethyldihydropteridine diphosphokinase [Kofleriaceae bacterium]